MLSNVIQQTIYSHSRSISQINQDHANDPYHHNIHSSGALAKMITDLEKIKTQLKQNEYSAKEKHLKNLAESCGIKDFEPVIVRGVRLLVKNPCHDSWAFANGLALNECYAYAHLHKDQFPHHNNDQKLIGHNATVAAFVMKLAEMNGTLEDDPTGTKTLKKPSI